MPARTSAETIEATDSGVSWAAIIAGAVAAAGISLMLAPIGPALGLNTDPSAWHRIDTEHTITVTAAIWVILVQWISSGVGGYLTGRLRTKWTGAHSHEVYFRDTAHGFLSWGLASLGAAVVLAMGTTHAAQTHGTEPDVSTTVLIIYALSLFVGAFIASAAAALGGIHRDEHYETGWDRRK